VDTLGRELRGRPTPEIGDGCRTFPLERKLVTWRDLLVAESIHIPEESRRSESIPRFIISKNSRSPNHPLSMVR
jgi:hypothetical protein